jgi:hypothetical protein
MHNALAPAIHTASVLVLHKADPSIQCLIEEIWTHVRRAASGGYAAPHAGLER